MPIVQLSAPPDLGAKAKYQDYGPWLLSHFFDHLCSYCLIRDDGVEVDHYEPRQMSPDKVHDPANLLLGCGRCNGAGCKSDYHPLHSKRRRKRDDTSGYLVLDVRVDDFAAMFEITADGGITSRAGHEADRAIWNITLLKLSLDTPTKRRKECLQLLEACEIAIELIAEGGGAAERGNGILASLLPELASRRLFFHVYGIPVSAPLDARLATVSR